MLDTNILKDKINKYFEDLKHIFNECNRINRCKKISVIENKNNMEMVFICDNVDLSIELDVELRKKLSCAGVCARVLGPMIGKAGGLIWPMSFLISISINTHYIISILRIATFKKVSLVIYTKSYFAIW